MVHPILTICSLLLIAVVSVSTSASNSRYEFATDAFRVLSKNNANQNLIYSPASIQSCLTLIYLAAVGESADELEKGLKLRSFDEINIVNEYREFLKEFRSTKDGPTFKVANGVYMNENYTIAPRFKSNAIVGFNTEVEKLDFDDSATAVFNINMFVHQHTDKILRHLPSDAIDKQTSVILVNAIYFNPKWSISLGANHHYTNIRFHINPNQRKNVSGIATVGVFKYAYLPELGAKAVEVPYDNSNLSMLFILPDKLDGLSKLETKLATIDLNEIGMELKSTYVQLSFPAFQIEFEVDLIESLKQLGILKIFTPEAELRRLLKSNEEPVISKVVHKVYIDLKESRKKLGLKECEGWGCEPTNNLLPLQMRNFKADHPFVFAIRTQSAVFFAGHVTEP